jgi:hypothetical protein
MNGHQTIPAEGADGQGNRGKEVRGEVDRVVKTGDVGYICDTILMQTRRMAGSAREAHEVVSKTAEIVHTFRETRDRIRAAGMYRYLMEGGVNSYSADVRPLIEFLTKEGYLGGPDSGLLDLGAGPGQMVEEWKKTGRPARGVDLSPSFVIENEDLRLGLIDNEYAPLLDVVDGGFRPGLVMTNMTLDRVRQPKQLLSNVTNLSRQFGASFVVSSILPIHPEDDDQNAEVKIIYTDPDHLLTPGKSVDEDRENILLYLRGLASDYDIDVHTLPYTIHSSGEKHEYTQYCFCGKPKKE